MAEFRSDPRSGVVRRTVVHDDYLESGIIRRKDAADAIADHCSAIIGRNDDGNKRGGHVVNIIANLFITAGGCAARRMATDGGLS